MRTALSSVCLAFVLATPALAQDWSVNGNASLNDAINFIGTTDAVGLNFRSNNQRVLSLFNQSTIVNADLYEGVFVLGGWRNNLAQSGATGSTVFGGLRFNSTEMNNRAYDIASTISGGASNTAGRNDGFLALQAYATVCGGFLNEASGLNSTAAGGSNNVAGGTNPFAAGSGATVRRPANVGGGDTDGDQGTFVWADRSSGSAFTSTGPNQFIVRAAGGVGLGTSTPRGQLESSGAGSFQFPQVVMNATTNVTDSFSRLAFTNTNTNKFWHFSAKCNGATPADDQLNYYYQDSNGQGRNPLQIRGDGRMSIGGPAPGTGVTLDVFGALRCVSLVQTSSARYKKGVEPVTGVLDRFLQLRPVAFTWDDAHGGQTDMGLIAEEVGALFPEAVATIDGAIEGINYSRVTALAIQAVKEQQGTVEALKRQNEELTARLERIERLMADRR